jgi:hypothetical protein
LSPSAAEHKLQIIKKLTLNEKVKPAFPLKLLHIKAAAGTVKQGEVS